MKKKELLLTMVIAVVLVLTQHMNVQASEDDYETAEGNEFSFAYSTAWEADEKEIIEGVTAYSYTLEDGFSIHLAEIELDRAEDLYDAFEDAVYGMEFDEEESRYYSEMMFYLGYDVPDDPEPITEFDRIDVSLKSVPEAEANYYYFASDHLYWRGIAITGEKNMLLVGADCTNSTPLDDILFLF